MDHNLKHFKIAKSLEKAWNDDDMGKQNFFNIVNHFGYFNNIPRPVSTTYKCTYGDAKLFPPPERTLSNQNDCANCTSTDSNEE